MLAIVSTSEVATCLHLGERQGIERKVTEIWEQCYKCVFFSAITGYDWDKKRLCLTVQRNNATVTMYCYIYYGHSFGIVKNSEFWDSFWWYNNNKLKRKQNRRQQ